MRFRLTPRALTIRCSGWQATFPALEWHSYTVPLPARGDRARAR